MTRALPVAAVVIAVLFAVSAALQLNDPDPLGWTTLYLAGSAVSILAARDLATVRWVAALVAVSAGVWGALIVMEGLGPITLAELLGDMKMKSPNTERWREVLGLGMVFGWCGALFLLGIRGREVKERGGAPTG